MLEEVATYSHAVLSYVDDDGYPMSVATDFRVNADRGTIELDAPAVFQRSAGRDDVTVLFSHVHPQPGVGYDQRRYVSVWGTVSRVDGVLEVRPHKTHGWDEQRMSFFELCERSVPVAHRYMRGLERERGRPVRPTLPLGWLIFLATRLPFLTATIVPVLLGAVVARSHGYSAWWLTLLALLGASAIHLGLNIANDVADSLSGADEANVTPTMYSGGSRMIQYGLVSRRAMTFASVCLYAVGIAIGLFLVVTRGLPLLWVGIAGIFLSVFYTSPPLRLVHRGLGEICVALGFGPIMVLGSYFVVAQRFSAEALYASLPVALLIMLVLYVNQVPDRAADARAGKRTLVVRLGRAAVLRGYALSAAAAFALIALGPLLGLLTPWALVALAAGPLAVQVYRGMRAHYDNPYALMDPMGKNVQLHLLTGLLLIAGYVTSIFV